MARQNSCLSINGHFTTSVLRTVSWFTTIQSLGHIHFSRTKLALNFLLPLEMSH